MENKITNCGLIALRNVTELKNISVKTLISLANDNGIILYPYKVPVDKIKEVSYPAIFHADNHFIYAEKEEELSNFNLTGTVLFTSPKKSYFKIPRSYWKSINGGSWAAIVVGAGTLAYGVVKDQKAKKDQKNAIAQRKPYKTPEEVFQILQATQNKAQGDTQQRDYLTGEVDNSFSQQLGVAERLGADPNDLSALFNSKIQNVLKIGEQFHATNMESFGKYLGALDSVAQNAAAEAGSEDNLIKDQLQGLAAQRAANAQTINSGINTTITGLSSLASNNLYTDKSQPALETPATVDNNADYQAWSAQQIADNAAQGVVPNSSTAPSYRAAYDAYVQQQLANNLKTYFNRGI